VRKEKVLRQLIFLLRPEPHLLCNVLFEILLELLFSLLSNICLLQEELGQTLMDNLIFRPCFPSTIFFVHLNLQTEQGTITTGMLEQFFDVNHDSKSILRINRHKSITFFAFKGSTKF